MKEIEIINGIGKYVNGNEHIKLNEELKIKVKFDKIVDKTFFIAYNNYEKIKGAVKEDGTFSLPVNFIKLGKLKLAIEERPLYGMPKTTQVEDLIIRETDSKVQSIPQIEELKEIVAKYTEIVEDLNEKYDTILKLISTSYDVGDEYDDIE